MKLVAIEDGGDWADAGVAYLAVPETVDLAHEDQLYYAWLQEVYAPQRRAGADPKFLSFQQWICSRHPTSILNPPAIEVYSRL